MGKKGKPKKQASRGALGGIGGLAKKAIGGGPPMGGGMQSGGLYRVNSRTGEIVKVSQKRRRKGYRMPRVVMEQIRAANDLTRSLSQAVVLAAMNK